MDLLPCLNKEFFANSQKQFVNQIKKPGSWTLVEDYLLVVYAFEGFSFNKIAMVMDKTPTPCKVRFTKLFGTTNWVRVATTPKDISSIIIRYLEIHYFENAMNFQWSDETILETYEFLKYYGF